MLKASVTGLETIEKLESNLEKSLNKVNRDIKDEFSAYIISRVKYYAKKNGFDSTLNESSVKVAGNKHGIKVEATYNEPDLMKNYKEEIDKWNRLNERKDSLKEKLKEVEKELSKEYRKKNSNQLRVKNVRNQISRLKRQFNAANLATVNYGGRTVGSYERISKAMDQSLESGKVTLETKKGQLISLESSLDDLEQKILEGKPVSVRSSTGEITMSVMPLDTILESENIPEHLRTLAAIQKSIDDFLEKELPGKYHEAVDALF